MDPLRQELTAYPKYWPFALRHPRRDQVRIVHQRQHPPAEHLGFHRAPCCKFTAPVHRVPPRTYCSTIPRPSLAMLISPFDPLPDDSGPRWTVEIESGRDASIKTLIQACAQFWQGSITESNVNIPDLGGWGWKMEIFYNLFLFHSPMNLLLEMHRKPCLSRVQTLNYYIIKAPNRRFRCLGILSPHRWCGHLGKNTLRQISIAELHPWRDRFCTCVGFANMNS